MIKLSALKEWLQVVSTDTGDDDLLTRIEERAVSILGDLCQDYFGAPKEITDTLDGTGTHELWLRCTPTKDDLAASEWNGSGWSPLSSGSFYRVGKRVIRIDGSFWSRGPLRYQLSYTAGYEPEPPDPEPPVPPGPGGSEPPVPPGPGEPEPEPEPPKEPQAPGYVRQAVLDLVRFLCREGRTYTLKELALPDVQTRPAGAQHVASVRQLMAIRRSPLL